MRKESMHALQQTDFIEFVFLHFLAMFDGKKMEGGRGITKGRTNKPAPRE
jgi:hypothetical protein